MSTQQLWGLARVVGHSMVPTLEPGDRLLVRHGATPVPGDLVVARFADGALTVKRVSYAAETGGGALGWFLLSDNPTDGIDSRHRGAVPRSAIVAVVRGRLWPRPGRLRDPRNV